jgi:hypothetical protein
MNRDSLSVLAGLVVMVSGMIVFFGTQGDAKTSSENPSAAPVQEWAPPTSAVAEREGITPEIPGVPAAVAGVLLDAGDAEELGTEDLTDLDQAVTRVLIAYGATLRVPIEADGGQTG